MSSSSNNRRGEVGDERDLLRARVSKVTKRQLKFILDLKDNSDARPRAMRVGPISGCMRETLDSVNEFISLSPPSVVVDTIEKSERWIRRYQKEALAKNRKDGARQKAGRKRREERSLRGTSFSSSPDVFWSPRLSTFSEVTPVLDPTMMAPGGNMRLVIDLDRRLVERIVGKSSQEEIGQKEREFKTVLRFALLPTVRSVGQVRDMLPSELKILVNGKEVVIATESRAKSEPVDISTFCVLRSSNVICLSWRASSSEIWVVGAFALKSGVKQLVEQIKKNDLCFSPDSTRVLVMKALSVSAGDGEGIVMEEESISMSLMCPLGRAKMQYPCRPVNCRHIQCFDAFVYLSMKMGETNTSRWACPVCNSEAPFKDLRIDSYLLKVLQSPQLGRDDVDIIMRKDGSWIKKEEGTTSEKKMKKEETRSQAKKMKKEDASEEKHILIDLSYEEDRDESGSASFPSASNYRETDGMKREESPEDLEMKDCQVFPVKIEECSKYDRYATSAGDIPTRATNAVPEGNILVDLRDEDRDEGGKQAFFPFTSKSNYRKPDGLKLKREVSLKDPEKKEDCQISAPKIKECPEEDRSASEADFLTVATNAFPEAKHRVIGYAEPHPPSLAEEASSNAVTSPPVVSSAVAHHLSPSTPNVVTRRPPPPSDYPSFGQQHSGGMHSQDPIVLFHHEVTEWVKYCLNCYYNKDGPFGRKIASPEEYTNLARDFSRKFREEEKNACCARGEFLSNLRLNNNMRMKMEMEIKMFLVERRST